MAIMRGVNRTTLIIVFVLGYAIGSSLHIILHQTCDCKAADQNPSFVPPAPPLDKGDCATRKEPLPAVYHNHPIDSSSLSPPIDPNQPSFAEILENSTSDKFWRHHYEKYYEKWLAPYRARPNVVLAEIGAKKGKSLRTWTQYFRNNPQLILGVAYGETSEGVETIVSNFTQEQGGTTGDVMKVLRGDQSDPHTLNTMCEMGPFDIIIDDGSHYPDHMVISFVHLWQHCVKPGGLYVIEDLETNYWKPNHRNIYNYKLKRTNGIGAAPSVSAVEKFKQLIDILPRYQLGLVPEMSILPGDDQICSMEFGMNIMAFHKCTLEELRDQRPRNAPFKVVADEKRIQRYMQKARSTNPDQKDKSVFHTILQYVQVM